MTDKELNGKARLKEALKLSDQTYADKYPKAECEIQYSDAYLKKIDRFIKRPKSPFCRGFDRTGRRMIGLAATVLIIFGCSVMTAVWMEPIAGFFETSASVTEENPVFQSSQNPNPTERPNHSASASESDPFHSMVVAEHEHEFDLFSEYDENKHYVYCSVEGCQAVYQDFHRYIHKPGTYHLECEFCGRKPK